ncbi:mannuronate-specific alginate lyase [Lelliottia sp. CFBP8978]|uniref:mannuronate-specific alginate lyase n=1 Tax=Lelliottia sp. CFBP8978 TaxID=3096522 RepID=UPI002A6A211A|nr:mannuronate-specific alginate lyase [Lelliottia sp. CFBP8978]MDY1035743.1 mannuronate-specific alginate lyase [Lelliottia sp. CFBP8978]
MRLILLLLLLPGFTFAAPLVPPPGFIQPLPHTAKGKCLPLPAPWTGSLVFRSKYEGSDSARATLNPEAEKAFRAQTQAITDFEHGISEMVWRYKQSGDVNTRNCILAGFNRWASAGALTSKETNHTGRAMRKWALATLATSWLELELTPQDSPQGARWISQLADRVVTDWDGLPLTKTNNHSYWAAWSVMAAAVATDRRDLFDWSLKEYRIAARQIDENGILPNEQKRGPRAVAYHHYALEPLVMIASFARANQRDIVQENHGALPRLAQYVLTQDKTHVAWLEPWCSTVKCDSVTLALRDAHRPLKNRRLGGQLTLIYAQ